MSEEPPIQRINLSIEEFKNSIDLRLDYDVLVTPVRTGLVTVVAI